LKKIERVGLDRAACVVVSGIIGIRKPERAIFHAAADGWGVEPTVVLFIGDIIEADIIGASYAGMMTAWMRRGREWPVSAGIAKPDFVINHVEEIRGAVWS
jgi:putative hydrolase of the HAD superfamily